ncbi:hypothetical protein FNV43_RR13004 [Rhamnella rubrinervis]|uniref:RNase H type-1 domain-containing protein n=1 Tax=Rhamnella rubrinervis TaxID=2594499 RepID=A0A8K0H0A6_9ROSA|nr:hypothetical protein FNV43_RR13004 [Rhamnella rubrinervis]
MKGSLGGNEMASQSIVALSSIEAEYREATKANTDAAYREGLVALAFVLRDDSGNIVYLESKLDRAESPLEAEFMALAWALKISEGKHWSNIIWSADSQEMVKEINVVEDPSQWETRYVALSCRRMLNSKHWKLNWNARSSNSLADSIAKLTLRCNNPFLFSSIAESFSSSNFPSSFSLIVRQDQADAVVYLFPLTVDELMSLGSGVVSSSKNMGFDDNKEGGEKSENEKVQANQDAEDGGERIGRQTSETSLYATDQEDEDDEGNKLQLGPQCTLKEQLEKDKDDESLRRWKEQLLGTVDLESVGEVLEPEVKITELSIISPGRGDIVLPIPEDGKPKGLWFTLKEGSRYNLKFAFKVSNNIVSGLKYTNTVWKTGMKVDSAKEMIGTFSPQSEPYTHMMPEETTPSGMFARGSYSARSKFLDDDNKCYLEINYTFDIRKEWAAT